MMIARRGLAMASVMAMAMAMAAMLLVAITPVSAVDSALLKSLETMPLDQLLDVGELLPVHDQLTPFEQFLMKEKLKDEQRALIEMEENEEGENEEESEEEADADSELDSETDADADVDADVDDMSALETAEQGTEQVTSNVVNFIEMDESSSSSADAAVSSESDAEVSVAQLAEAESMAQAESEAPMVRLAKDPSIDPEVRDFLRRSALRSENEELKALEEGQLEFDEKGNDVLLEHENTAEELDAELEAELRQKMEERWKAEGYYQNPEASQLSPEEEAALAFVQVQEFTNAQQRSKQQLEEAQQDLSESDSDSDSDSESDSEADAEDAAAEKELSKYESTHPFSVDADNQVTDLVFLENGVEFSPEDAKGHKTAHIGKMRHERTRAKRIQTKYGVKPTSSAKSASTMIGYGPWDERRDTEESRKFSPEMEQALNAERKQRLGTVRPIGTSRAPFCATYPFCQQTPPPPELSNLPQPEDLAIVKAEMARLDPMKFLPPKLADLKKDPYRFGQVFQKIYERNQHNEKLANAMGTL